MPHVLNPLYVVVTKVILAIHSVLAPLFGKTSGVSWGLSLFFLTVLVRILLFPIFVKQIKTQRAMSELAPKVKELQTKYKKDRERMNQEVMALYKEHNANPLMGCLPLLLQMPVFYALFHVLRYIAEHGGQAGGTSKGVAACTAYLQTKPKGFGSAKYGWSPDTLCTAGHAKVFGVPLALGFKTASKAVVVRCGSVDCSHRYRHRHHRHGVDDVLDAAPADCPQRRERYRNAVAAANHALRFAAAVRAVRPELPDGRAHLLGDDERLVVGSAALRHQGDAAYCARRRSAADGSDQGIIPAGRQAGRSTERRREEARPHSAGGASAARRHPAAADQPSATQ